MDEALYLLVQGKTGGQNEELASQLQSSSANYNLKISHGITTINNASPFGGNTFIKTLTIPSTSTSIISSNQFGGCTNITEAIILGGSINAGAFSSNTNLEKLYIGENVTSIASGAFSGCSKLADVTILNGTLQSGAFGGCKGLINVKIANGSVEAGAFSSASIENLDIGKDITSIADNAFASGLSINNLTTPHLENFSTAFDTNLLKTNLISLNLIGGEPITEKYEFSEYNAMTDLTVGVNVCQNAFNPCNSLNKVKILSSVETIGNNAFYEDPITVLEIEDGLKTIGTSAFQGCKIESLVLPGSINTLEYNAFDMNSNLSSLTLNDGIETIGEQAFCYCISLKEVEIPESVKLIDKNAFENCNSLESVIVNAGEIKDSFYQCPKLHNIVIKGKVENIGDNAFSSCGDEQDEEMIVTIEEGVKTIGSQAFISCHHIRKIDIPSTVISIGTDAFLHTTDLEQININKTNDGTLTGSPWGEDTKVQINWKN